MILKTISEDGRLCTHESDTFKIKKVGTEEIYISATDLNPCMFEYEETDILIQLVEPETETENEIIQDVEIIE